MDGGHSHTGLVAVADAQERLLAMVADRLTAEERVPLRAAHGRVLARPVATAWDVPGCDNSAMDGHAVWAADCGAASEAAPVRLPVLAEAWAGSPVGRLAPGTAVAVATGAPIPLGADAVIPVEDSRQDGDGSILVVRPPRPGAHVRRRGGDAVPGTVIVAAGRRLRPVDIAGCAAAGAESVWARRSPRVALLSGGDELVPLGVTPAPHQVTDSNAAMLAAAIEAAGGEVVSLGIVADTRDAVRERLAAATGCDLLITSAGVSVGGRDHVREVVAELGGIEAWRLAMRPGRPLLIGRVGQTPMLGLPGNPASAAVTFELFGRTAILALQGARPARRRRIAVRAGEPVDTPPLLETYVRVRLSEAPDGVPLALSSGDQTSSMLVSLAGADALMVVPVGVGRVEPGTVMSALELT
jgi:molybdopterin molybdotransferase